MQLSGKTTDIVIYSLFLLLRKLFKYCYQSTCLKVKQVNNYHNITFTKII